MQVLTSSTTIDVAPNLADSVQKHMLQLDPSIHVGDGSKWARKACRQRDVIHGI